MIQRRKAATYGKSSRKPISDFSSAAADAFAQASEPAPAWASDGPIRMQKCSATKALATDGSVVEIATRSMAPKTVSKDREIVSQSQDSLYDLPATDGDGEQSAHASDAGSRKRRKLTPKVAQPPGLRVYDDDSLQRHIAAETEKRPGKFTSGKRNATASPKRPPTYAQGISEDLEQYDRLPVKDRASNTQKPTRPDTTPEDIAYKAKAPRAKKPAPPRDQYDRSSASKTPPRKTRGKMKSPIRPIQNPSTPPKAMNKLPARPSSDRAKDVQPEKERFFPPVTPPKRSSSVGKATTPKQRELWSKLLSNDPRTASPSHLDLPGLRIADQKGQNRKVNPSIPEMRNKTGAAPAEPGKRAGRLVDFLITSDGDGSSSEELSSSRDDESSNAELSKSARSEMSVNDDIMTTQTSPSADSNNKRLPPQERGLSSTTQSISSLQGGLKVTYARQRSYRTDNDLTDAAMFDVPSLPEANHSRKTQRDRFGGSVNQNIDNELDDAQDSQSGAMRSIHELREAGGNTRLVGELETILDDLDERQDPSISTRRSSLMSLTSKLLEPSTCRLFVDQGLESRLLAQVNFGHDIIERSLLAASILQILFHTTSGAFLSQINHARTKNFLIGLLTTYQDLTKRAKLRETNMSKLAQSEYINLCNSLLKSPVWRALKPSMLSGQILALQCLEFLVRHAREAGSFAEILSSDAIGCVAETSIPSSGPLEPSMSYSTICLELALSILESSSISGAAENRESEWAETTHARIAGILPLLVESQNVDFGNLQTLTLRLYLNLTNTNPHLCEIFSKPPLVNATFKTMLLHFERLSEPDSQTKDVHLLDNLVLSLGYLINLAESSDTMRHLVMDLQNQDMAFLESLLQLFMKKRKKAAEVRSFTLWI